MSLAVAQLALYVVPFRVIAGYFGKTLPGNPPAPFSKGGNVDPIVLGIGTAIGSMARRLPWKPKCLAQAIAGKIMLKRRYIPSALYLGVRKEADRSLAAHAWLRSGDIILTGNYQLDTYTVLSAFIG